MDLSNFSYVLSYLISVNLEVVQISKTQLLNFLPDSTRLRLNIKVITQLPKSQNTIIVLPINEKGCGPLTAGEDHSVNKSKKNMIK
jgi:hypothetical protein